MSPLSLTGKHWVLPEEQGALNASHTLLRLMKERGIDTEPKLILPSVYQDMDRAVERIERAVTSGECVGIFGDYDCDGVTATAQLVSYFRRRSIEPIVRLPHRVRDGYGLNMQIVSELREQGITLLLTCDTGIASVREIAALKEAGIDTIVTDHHHTGQELPPAYAIIHPAVSTHPLPHPSGAGVVFSLVYALEKGSWAAMQQDLSLAMIGTIADLVPLTGANRAYATLGLKALDGVQGPLGQLRERCKTNDKPLSALDIAFRLAPRINAAGRMDDADIALRALLEGGQTLSELDALNEQRQALTRELVDNVVEGIDTTDTPLLLSSVSSEYPHGIVGLIAGKLTETFGKPSLVATTDGRTCTASLRSPALYNIAEGLSRCSDLLLSFGGHAQAAGCTFALKNYDALCSALTKDILEQCDIDLLKPTVHIDAIIDSRDITTDFCKRLSLLEPFGQGNPEPLFLVKQVALQDARPCGSDGSHLQARISGIKAIGFGLAKHLPSEPVDIVCRLGIDEWNGRTQPQIFMQDLSNARSSVLANN